MTIRTLIAFILISSAAVININCGGSKIYQSYASAKIVTAGDIYSTYELSSEEKEKIKAAAVNGKIDPEYIFSHMSESGWPKPLNDFTYRIDHPQDLQALKVRIFADLGTEKYLLIVPASENKRSKLNIKEDVFLVYKKEAIQKK